jgi:hypothetical protein
MDNTRIERDGYEADPPTPALPSREFLAVIHTVSDRSGLPTLLRRTNDR